MTGGPGHRVLVAGIGNVFFGDDGFGPAVVTRLSGRARPDGVDVEDYGIRGVHLAYDLLDGRHRSVVLVDALPTGEAPGTLSVVEVDDPQQFHGSIDAHSMGPAAVLSTLSAVGAPPLEVLVVGCQPGQLDQGMNLSPPVAAALDDAVRLVLEVAAGQLGAAALTAAGTRRR
jgi:hydrogenase maturation protease